ncbi:hypothetical protein Hypma_016051 [Hypsizygus marmoreus]|uniref:CENP-V/GFA domain-containing protein n=1 Tax=Hypsizygus marmoreus TaxID=39966 RepID=A0A369KB93_HYPMA|nr:hypothetical protein Hypma_016051 [Hypsizygus marmoreus]
MSDNSNPSQVVLRGGCFCRAVSYEVIGNPIRSAYCHCTLCQRLNACPFIHTIHFPASAFKWTHGQPHEDALDSFSVPEKPWKNRWRCKRCGAAVASYHGKENRWSVWGAQLERDAGGKIKDWDTVKPTAHIFYGTRMVNVDDALGKWVGYENKSERVL